MHATAGISSTPADKSAHYRQLQTALGALVAGETDPVANQANFAAMVYHGPPELNWAGFYLLRNAAGALRCG